MVEEMIIERSLNKDFSAMNTFIREILARPVFFFFHPIAIKISHCL